MPSKPSQRERVLQALRHAGPTGLTSIDFLLPQVCDHGKPITRLAARIQDLRDEGYSIDSSGTRHGVAVYVLKDREVAPAAVVAPTEMSGLFDPAVTHRPLSPYDKEAA